MNRVFLFLYGNHPRTRSLFAQADKLIRLLRDNGGSMSRKELASRLFLDLDKANDKKKFYTLVRPLFGKVLVSEDRGRVYRLSFALFGKQLSDLRQEAYYYLVGS